MKRESLKEKVRCHPCYSGAAHFRFGRVHLPVARRCNIQCNYCVRSYACANENRPGVTTRVLSPREAVEAVRRVLEAEPRIRVAGIAGPGEPLANSETFETFELVRDEFPELMRCLSTNGLALPANVERLAELEVTALTVTVNAVSPEVGEKIYAFVRHGGRVLRGREAFSTLSRNQLLGLRRAAELGMAVKVNSVLIPGINDSHLLEVAEVVKELGAYTMNIIPLIPQGRFAHLEAPSQEQLERVRAECSKVIRQFRHCRQCRADAVGVPGEGCSSLLAVTGGM